VNKYFTKHTGALNQIIATIMNDKTLKFMDSQMYPEWPKLITNGIKNLPRPNLWLPAGEDEIRRGFYICNMMIQLMENVYTELDLEINYKHPDNRGG
jgi:hypothetical protein